MNELEIIQYRQIDGLSVFFDTVEYRTSHFHSEWEFLWLLDQPLSVAHGQSRFKMEPGEMLLFAPNEPHAFHKWDREATFLCLQLAQERLPQMEPLTMEGDLPHLYADSAAMEDLQERMTRIARAYFEAQDGYELLCTGEGNLLLYRLLQLLPHHLRTREEANVADKRNARLRRLIRFVDENYMHKIRLADFAEAEGCSMGYLSQFIKKTMNQSFQEYVMSVRFNCACKLMAAGGKQMLDVCMESGFSDYRYFSRAFQQQYGMTPEEYSRYKKKETLEIFPVHHSLHSIERFYTREDSLRLLHKYLSI